MRAAVLIASLLLATAAWPQDTNLIPAPYLAPKYVAPPDAGVPSRVGRYERSVIRDLSGRAREGSRRNGARSRRIVGSDEEVLFGREVEAGEHAIDRGGKRQVRVGIDQTGHQRRSATIDDRCIARRDQIGAVADARDVLPFDHHGPRERCTTGSVEHFDVSEHDRTHNTGS